jgi:RNA polymerase sigma-70 factor (ECF subfamily)
MRERRQLINVAQTAAVIRAFKVAWEAKDVDALVRLLDPDATAVADSGGRALAFLHPIEGGERIARAWAEIGRAAPAGLRFAERMVNGQPGLVAEQGGSVVTVFAFEVAGDRVKRIWAVRNPDKLRAWSAQPPRGANGGHDRAGDSC